MTIFLRIFYQATDKEIANQFANFLMSELSELCTSKIFKIAKYWKMPECFEVSLDLNVIYSEEIITKIINKLGNGWELIGDSYIWNNGKKHSFISPDVKWASLEFIE